jgi:hypothetical protein
MEQRLYDPALPEVKIAFRGEQAVPGDQPPLLEHFTFFEFLRVSHEHLTDKIGMVDRVSRLRTKAEGNDIAFRSQRLDELERVVTELKGVSEERVTARHSRNTSAESGRTRRLHRPAALFR